MQGKKIKTKNYGQINIHTGLPAYIDGLHNADSRTDNFNK
jgi:hypothetical protein